ncbi:MAG: SLOG family protein [Pseudonocardiaceae bacterium]
MSRRVLITGSRAWTNPVTIRDALLWVWDDGDTILVTGGCPRGADRIAELLWSRWGGRVERHPADWDQHGRSAGFRRNAAMVQAGADLCLAFLRGDSPGARHTARLAEQAGIPTLRHLAP